MSALLSTISSWILPLFLFGVLLFGLSQQVSIYQAFLRGGREGVTILLEIIPCLVAMMVAIELFQVSGALDYLLLLIQPLSRIIGIPKEILPLAAIRTLSGSGAQAYLIQLFEDFGPDSLLGHMASVVYGSTETTFYIVTVYFGAVNIKNLRHAISAGLTADLIGLFASVYLVTRFYN